jgi:hypothetical protein
MPYSVEEAMSAYGFVYSLAKSIPELNTLLTQAISAMWTPENLQARIESSNWWKNNADTARNLAIQRATDPTTYNRNLANATNLIWLKAQQLGRSITATQARTLALRSMVENASWDDQRLSQLLTDNTRVEVGRDGSYQGNAADLQAHLTKTAQNYGVAYTRSWLDAWTNEIQSGRNSLEGWESVMKARAKAAYPQFAAQLDAGMTIRDIADPYISTYAQTLEVPETQVTLNDTAIKKALSQTTADGKTLASMPLWQFQRQLKDDPRYDRTQQAKDDAFSALGKIGKDFGFVGSSGQ